MYIKKYIVAFNFKTNNKKIFNIKNNAFKQEFFRQKLWLNKNSRLLKTDLIFLSQLLPANRSHQDSLGIPYSLNHTYLVHFVTGYLHH